jgi:hypothetical protein
MGQELTLAAGSFLAFHKHPIVGNRVLASRYIAHTEACTGTERSRVIRYEFDAFLE